MFGISRTYFAKQVRDIRTRFQSRSPRPSFRTRGRDGAALNTTLAGYGALLYAYGIAFAAAIRLGSDAP